MSLVFLSGRRVLMLIHGEGNTIESSNKFGRKISYYLNYLFSDRAVNFRNIEDYEQF